MQTWDFAPARPVHPRIRTDAADPEIEILDSIPLARAVTNPGQLTLSFASNEQRLLAVDRELCKWFFVIQRADMRSKRSGGRLWVVRLPLYYGRTRQITLITNVGEKVYMGVVGTDRRVEYGVDRTMFVGVPCRGACTCGWGHRSRVMPPGQHPMLNHALQQCVHYSLCSAWFMTHDFIVVFHCRAGAFCSSAMRKLQLRQPSSLIGLRPTCDPVHWVC